MIGRRSVPASAIRRRPALRAGLGAIYSPAHEARSQDDRPARVRRALSACGSQGIQIAKTSPYYKGASLFLDHCSGCHTLSVVGAEGSATVISNRVRTNGPNFNIRKENEQQVLYAIRNGGFSGAIMPENVVVGESAEDVARFLAKYSGLKAAEGAEHEHHAVDQVAQRLARPTCLAVALVSFGPGGSRRGSWHGRVGCRRA